MKVFPLLNFSLFVSILSLPLLASAEVTVTICSETVICECGWEQYIGWCEEVAPEGEECIQSLPLDRLTLITSSIANRLAMQECDFLDPHANYRSATIVSCHTLGDCDSCTAECVDPNQPESPPLIPTF